jgi:hypothetical protein
MLNPDEVRQGPESSGETLVKKQLGDGVLSAPVAEIAVRWLAAKQDERIEEQRVVLKRLLYLAWVAACGAIAGAVFSIANFNRLH